MQSPIRTDSKLRSWGTLVVGVLMVLFLMPWHRSESSKGIAIHATIKKIARYSQGEPIIVLRDGRQILLKLPGGGQQYVRAGDSIAKRANSDTVVVSRRYAAYTEVCVFGHGEHYGANDLDYAYSGLLQRYRIPNAGR